MTYKWNAADYARHSSGQEQWARELLPLLELKLNDRVLDIGCGDGRITRVLSELVPSGNVLGIDSSAEMIEHASRLEGANLRFERRDALELGFREAFTAIFSNAVLHWIRDQARVVQQIATALRPGGRVLVQCGGHGNGQRVIDCFTYVAERPRWSNFFRNFESTYGFYTDTQYRKWLEDAGLVIDDVRLIPKDMIHPTVDAFTGWLRTAWHPYTSPVPEDFRAQYLSEVGEVYLREYPPDQNGCVHARMMRLQFRAHKPA